MKENTELSKLPNSWGESELTRFLDIGRLNQVRSYVHLKRFIEKIEELDDVFEKVSVHPDLHNHPGIASLLFLRSHSAFRAAASLTMAGHANESFAVMRAVLEYAGYSLLLTKDPSLEEIWLDKNQSDDGKRRARGTFTHARITKVIAERDSNLKMEYDHLYERCIDNGAHPNALGLLTSMSASDEAGLIVDYLHGDGRPLQHSFSSLQMVGRCALIVLAKAYPEPFRSLGLKKYWDANLVYQRTSGTAPS